jgi:hypothetical protein
MAVYIEQHRACARGLEMLDSLRPPLEQHLKDEVGTLLELDKDRDNDTRLRIWRVVEKAAGQRPDFMVEVLPVVLGLCDRTSEGGIHAFPPLPCFLPYLMHYWFARKHTGAWRFRPSDMWSQPRPLQSLGSK